MLRRSRSNSSHSARASDRSSNCDMVEENGRCHGIVDVGVYRGDVYRGHLREENTSLLTTVAIEDLRMCMRRWSLPSNRSPKVLGVRINSPRQSVRRPLN